MAEQNSRIYAVKTKEGEIVALVEAVNNIQVLGHMARKTFDVSPAKQHELIAAIKAGREVETLNSAEAPVAEAAQEGGAL